MQKTNALVVDCLEVCGAHGYNPLTDKAPNHSIRLSPLLALCRRDLRWLWNQALNFLDDVLSLSNSTTFSSVQPGACILEDVSKLSHFLTQLSKLVGVNTSIPVLLCVNFD